MHEEFFGDEYCYPTLRADPSESELSDESSELEAAAAAAGFAGSSSSLLDESSSLDESSLLLSTAIGAGAGGATSSSDELSSLLLLLSSSDELGSGGGGAGAFFFLLAPGFLATLLVVRFVGAIVDLVLLLWQWAIRASPKRATCGFLRVRSCLALLL